MEFAGRADTSDVSLRVGIDLVATSSVNEALTRRPEQYLRRVYTQREVADCSRRAAVDPQLLAARFAAKEAVMKILRPPADQAVPWRCIGVHRQASGAPCVELRGAAAALAARQGIGVISISLTHEGDTSAAIAIAEIGAV